MLTDNSISVDVMEAMCEGALQKAAQEFHDLCAGGSADGFEEYVQLRVPELIAQQIATPPSFD